MEEARAVSGSPSSANALVCVCEAGLAENLFYVERAIMCHADGPFCNGRYGAFCDVFTCKMKSSS